MGSPAFRSSTRALPACGRSLGETTSASTIFVGSTTSTWPAGPSGGTSKSSGRHLRLWLGGSVRTDHRPRPGSPSVAIVHDYLTQRGGAERVVLLLAETFPDAPIHTSLYHPAGTFPEFAGLDIRTTPLNRIPLLRSQHRLALPVLAPSFSALRVDADVLLCSSSGWAHGTRTHGRKVVYCHAPARWLYQAERYLGPSQVTLGHRSIESERAAPPRGDTLRRAAQAIPLRALSRPLRHWDRHAATTAHRYLAISTAVSQAIQGRLRTGSGSVVSPAQPRARGPGTACGGSGARILLVHCPTAAV